MNYGKSMNCLKIRDYRDADLEDVVKIYNESFIDLRSCWPNPMTLEWFMKRFGGALKAKTGTVFIAEHDGVPVGYVLITTLNRPQVGLVALISGICVVPSFQRRGIGMRLMEEAIDWAKKQGAVLVENDDEIIKNPRAVSFFEKLGFEIFHKGAYMSKDLTSTESFALPEKLRIRELQVEDLDQLLRVRKESFRELGPWYAEPDEEGFKRGMKNRIGRDDVKVFVAITDNQIIGYVVCSIRTNGLNGDIRVICVLPEYRKRGIGTALMAHSFNFLRKNKVQTVSTVTETAEGFYKRVGFKVDARFVRVRKLL